MKLAQIASNLYMNDGWGQERIVTCGIHVIYKEFVNTIQSIVWMFISQQTKMSLEYTKRKASSQPKENSMPYLIKEKNRYQTFK